MRYNVVSVMPNGDLGEPLLGQWVCAQMAHHWTLVYTDKYVGKAYPNGEGFYPWAAFIVVALP